MASQRTDGFKWQMMELPDGITTSNGNWYHINSEQIEDYAPGLLKRIPLERLIKEADAWVKSSDGLSLFLYFLLVYVTVSPLIACLISLAFFMLWYFNTSAFLNLVSSPIVKLLTTDGFVYVASSILLMGFAFNTSIASWGINVEFDALWYGLGLFFLFKVGLMRLLIRFIQSKAGKAAIEMPDRILNMLIIRYGMRHGILTGKVNEMQDKLIEIANYHKTRKKK
ncbi:MAG: hypothetical protein ED557_12450 [Balneola sp.]|nr:MAG: hypothetical protein ED557_12450 [Balneola sp.]